MQGWKPESATSSCGFVHRPRAPAGSVHSMRALGNISLIFYNGDHELIRLGLQVGRQTAKCHMLNERGSMPPPHCSSGYVLSVTLSFTQSGFPFSEMMMKDIPSHLPIFSLLPLQDSSNSLGSSPSLSSPPKIPIRSCTHSRYLHYKTATWLEDVVCSGPRLSSYPRRGT